MEREAYIQIVKSIVMNFERSLKGLNTCDLWAQKIKVNVFKCNSVMHMPKSELQNGIRPETEKQV